MPRHDITRHTSFVVEGEAWSMVEHDFSSVPGIVYMSLTEEKLNTIYDDAINNIADTDRLASYTLALPAESQSFCVGDVVEPQFTIVKDGKPIKLEYTLSSNTKDIVRYVNGVFTAVAAGEAEIAVHCENCDLLLTVAIADSRSIVIYLEGDSIIKLGRTAKYTLIGAQDVEFSLDNELASIVSVEGNSCLVRANEKNNLGKVILTATCGETSYEKEVSIVPLW